MREVGEPEQIRIFEFNDEKGEFLELEVSEGVPLSILLDSEAILLFVDAEHKVMWHWIGINSSIRARFHAGYNVVFFRDRIAFAFNIKHVDEGDEPTNFRILLGLEDEKEYEEEEIAPQYQETEEDKLIFEDMSLKEILLILRKTELPEGYERKMVIINGDIFYYREYEDALGVRTERLFSLKEQVEDGPYLMENFIPRVLFSYNKIILIEFLQVSHKVFKKKNEPVEEFQRKMQKISTGIESDYRSALYGKIIQEKKKKRNTGDVYPYPYIFKPPTPPDDLAIAGNPQVNQPITERDPEDEPYCMNCGSILSEGQSICHVCKKVKKK
jgi:hypothetical protein